eukprot:Opistho-2@93423
MGDVATFFSRGGFFLLLLQALLRDVCFEGANAATLSASTITLPFVLASAESGDTIQLAAGTYSSIINSGPIVVSNKALAFVRNPSALTAPIFSCRTVLSSSQAGFSSAFNVQLGANVSFVGITFRSCGRGGIVTPIRFGIEVGFNETNIGTVNATTSEVSFTDCIFTTSGQVLAARNQARVTMTRTSIADNLLRCCTFASFPSAVDMISITGGSRLTMASSNITTSTGFHAVISAQSTSVLTFESVIFLDNAASDSSPFDYGISAMILMQNVNASFTQCRFTNNTFFNNIQSSQSTISITGSTFTGAPSDAAVFAGVDTPYVSLIQSTAVSTVTIVDSLFTDSRPFQRAIAILSYSSIVLQRNVFRGMGCNTITLVDTTGTRFTLNGTVFEGNRVVIILDFAIAKFSALSGATCMVTSDFYNNTAAFLARTNNFNVLSFQDCNFVGNQANALWYSSGFSTIQVLRSKITGNTAVRISDITDDSAATFSDVTLSANSVSSGMSQDLRSTVRYERCQFTGHVDYSSLMTFAGSSFANISDCSFVGNDADDFDGTLIKAYGRSATLVSLTTFKGNLDLYTCDFREYATVNISSTSFIGNVAVDNGGAFRASGNARIAVQSTLFLDNYAENGGAVVATNTAAVTIQSANFSANAALQGGAIFAKKSSRVVVLDSSFTGNTALSTGVKNFNGLGGAVRLLDVASFKITNSALNANIAKGDGGAIYTDGNVTVSATGCSFLENNALKTDGGAIFSGGHSSMLLNGSSFVRNSALFAGGALSIRSLRADDLLCSGCRFVNNTAEQGAVLYAANPRVLPAEFDNITVESPPSSSQNVSGSPSRLRTVTYPPALVYSGETGREFSVEMLDNRGRRVTTFRENPAVIRLSVGLFYNSTAHAAQTATSARARIFGDALVSTTESLIKFSFGLIAYPGNYTLVMTGESAASEIESTQFNLTVSECPASLTGRVVTSEGIATCVPGPAAASSSGSSHLEIILPATLLGFTAFVVVFALFYRHKRRQIIEKSMNWLIDFKDLIFEKEIGQGSFGKVFVGQLRGSTVAIKVIRDGQVVIQESAQTSVRSGFTNSIMQSTSAGEEKVGRQSLVYSTFREDIASIARKPSKEDLSSYRAAVTAFIQEIDVMIALRHPNIVLFMGASLAEPNIALVVEFMANGSLTDVFDRLTPSEFDWTLRLKFALDAAKGMEYLHSNSPPLLHLDLKSPNLLIDDRMRLKVSDFGLATLQRAKSENHAIGTLYWMAPELITGTDQLTGAADVYSYGIILWELMGRCLPYRYAAGMAPMLAMHVVRSHHRPMPLPESAPAPFVDLMRSCWDADPSSRPNFTSISRSLEAMAPDAGAWEDTVLPAYKTGDPESDFRHLISEFPDNGDSDTNALINSILGGSQKPPSKRKSTLSGLSSQLKLFLQRMA